MKCSIYCFFIGEALESITNDFLPTQTGERERERNDDGFHEMGWLVIAIDTGDENDIR